MLSSKFAITARHCVVENQHLFRQLLDELGAPDHVWLTQDPSIDLAVLEFNDSALNLSTSRIVSPTTLELGSNLWNATACPSEGQTGKYSDIKYDYLTSTLQFSGSGMHSETECQVLSGPGRSGHSGSVVLNSEGHIVSVIVAAAGPRSFKPLSIKSACDLFGAHLESEFNNATSQRGFALPVSPYFAKPIWTRYDTPSTCDAPTQLTPPDHVGGLPQALVGEATGCSSLLPLGD
jgi:hypothetical protein